MKVKLEDYLKNIQNIQESMFGLCETQITDSHGIDSVWLGLDIWGNLDGLFYIECWLWSKPNGRYETTVLRTECEVYLNPETEDLHQNTDNIFNINRMSEEAYEAINDYINTQNLRKLSKFFNILGSNKKTIVDSSKILI
jgi:hypothetical protein